MNKNHQTVKQILTLLLIIFCLIFLTSGIVLTKQVYRSQSNNTIYKNIKKNAFSSTGTADELNTTQYNYQNLTDENSDCIGWVRIHGTNIDYPVVWKEADNSFYLTHDFSKENSKYGVPFIDGFCIRNNKINNVLIYGHHMRDGSMFADLVKYQSKEYRAKHPSIILYLKEHPETYNIFSVCRMQDNAATSFYRMMRDSQTNADIFSSALKKSIYPCGSKITNYQSGQRIILLSTCDYSIPNGRFLVFGISHTK